MNNNDYFDPEDTIGFLLWDANRAINGLFSDRIARHGLSLALWPFLRALWADDGITQRELSEKVRKKAATKVAALNKLEDRGLVRCEGNKKDARKTDVFLTTDGRKVIPGVEAVNTQYLENLSLPERSAFKDMIRRVRNSVTGS